VALDPNCIFCKIIEGEIPADIVLRNENVVAFNDLNPQAPTHVLLIPTLHTENAAGVARNSATITADLFLAAEQIATERGLNGYRTVFNTGADAGQSVFTLTYIYWAVVQWHGHPVKDRFIRIWSER
jgi:histidine triad (HIT) family protein